MARNPDDRPQTMEALEYELNKCLAGRGVAVAQILGMTTDANVVATLNPGLSMRTLDERQSSRARDQLAGASGCRAPARTAACASSPGMSSGPAMSTAAARADWRARPTSRPHGDARASSQRRDHAARRRAAPRAVTPPPPISEPIDPRRRRCGRRSALGVFGWLLLAAVLFGGVGALLYVALGERGDRASREPRRVAAERAGERREPTPASQRRPAAGAARRAGPADVEARPAAADAATRGGSGVEPSSTCRPAAPARTIKPDEAAASTSTAEHPPVADRRRRQVRQGADQARQGAREGGRLGAGARRCTRSSRR